ncbi:MAG: STAS domain-containing protein [Planctomycetota bacterium]|jgi:anti-anti-sigma factor
MARALSVESESRDDVTLVRVEGEVHNDNAHILDDGLTEVTELGEPVVLDLGGVSLMTSPGLGLLIKHTERLKDPEKMIIAGLRPKVLEVFRALGLDQFFLIVDSVEKAIETIQKRGEDAS